MLNVTDAGFNHWKPVFGKNGSQSTMSETPQTFQNNTKRAYK